MALSWQQAQKNELEFWQDIYIHNKEDLEHYQPITTTKSIDFSQKTIRRFNLDFSDLDRSQLADIGCGPYGILKGLAAYSSQSQKLSLDTVYGIDPLINEYLKFNILPQGDRFHYLACQGESIALANNTLDFAFCINVIDHVENPERVIQEIHRVLKPGGELCCAVHVVTNLARPLRPFLFLFDKNHPHHFTTEAILNSVERVFNNAQLTSTITMIEDQPEFTFGAIFTAKADKMRSLKRWLSTFLLKSVYIRATK
jgi:SAM-dependent methyltransferase